MGRASRRKKIRNTQNRPAPSESVFSRIKAFVQRNRRGVRASIIFAASVGIFVFIFSTLVNTNVFYGVISFTATSTAFILNIFGANAEVTGNIVASSNSAIMIVNECTAIVPMIIFFSAVLAYPSSIKFKLIGLPIGLVALFVLNMIRLVTLFYIGGASESFLNIAHLMIWQPLMIIAVIVFWLIWVGRVNHVRTA